MPPKTRRPSRYAKGVQRGRAYRATGKYPLRYYYGSSANQNAATLQAAVRRVLNKNSETKQSNQSPTDGQEIYHNNFISVSNTLLSTSQGVEDPAVGSSNNRIGDEIQVRGLSIKTMLEINERYSDVTFRLLVVKSAKGDTPTRATLFNGLSGNKMIDSINKERYTILASRVVKLKQGNPGFTNSTGGTAEVAVLGTNAGIEYATANPYTGISRATKIVKMWIPGYKLANAKNSMVKYEHQSSQPKFFDYHFLIYAYSNYTTAQDIWYVARYNDTVIQLYFKDL